MELGREIERVRDPIDSSMAVYIKNNKSMGKSKRVSLAEITLKVRQEARGN